MVTSTNNDIYIVITNNLYIINISPYLLQSNKSHKLIQKLVDYHDFLHNDNNCIMITFA